jgi:peptidoglycan biosynthesis protein MviN/MurJ (putative lipid II flippase)
MKLTKGNVYGAFGGSIFGSVCWIFVIASITKDWLTALSILMFAVMLFIISTKKCLQTPDKYWRIVITDMMSIALLTFLVVNLRWERWMEFYPNRSSGFDIPLWVMNLLLLAIFAILLVIFILRSRAERQFREKQPNGDKRREQQHHILTDN